MGDTQIVESRRSRRARPRRRATFLSVLGEILITAGVVTLLYVSWQMWIGDVIIGAQRNDEGQALIEQWAQPEDPTLSTPDETPDAAPQTPEPTTEPSAPAVEIPILPPPGNAEVFAVMQVPRFGPDYAVSIAGGTTRAGTLDHVGIGHYNGSPMPGEDGNVALAAHRTTYGKPFADIASLRIGDAIVITTPQGWYTYRFRTLEYVTPTEISVLLPVPQKVDVATDGKYLTMTSCSPKFSMTERIVGYSLFESFTPVEAGPPAALTEGAI